jgi:hypothetical protein
MVQCWPFYLHPYDGKINNYVSPTDLTKADPTKVFDLTLKPDTPARYVAMCTPTLSNAGYSTILGNYFKLRSVSLQVPLDFVMPQRVSSSALTLSVNNAYRWLNNQWDVGDPEMATSVNGITAGGAGSEPPPAFTFSASVRVQF